MTKREFAFFVVEDYDETHLPVLGGLADAVEELASVIRIMPLDHKFENGRVFSNNACTQLAFEEHLRHLVLTPAEDVFICLAGHGIGPSPGLRPAFVTFGLRADSRGLDVQAIVDASLDLARAGKRVILLLDFCFSGAVPKLFEELQGDDGKWARNVVAIASASATGSTSPGSTFIATFLEALNAEPAKSGVLLLQSVLTRLTNQFHGDSSHKLETFLGAELKDYVFGASEGRTIIQGFPRKRSKQTPWLLRRPFFLFGAGLLATIGLAAFSHLVKRSIDKGIYSDCEFRLTPPLCGKAPADTSCSSSSYATCRMSLLEITACSPWINCDGSHVGVSRTGLLLHGAVVP